MACQSGGSPGYLSKRRETMAQGDIAGMCRHRPVGYLYLMKTHPTCVNILQANTRPDEVC